MERLIVGLTNLRYRMFISSTSHILAMSIHEDAAGSSFFQYLGMLNMRPYNALSLSIYRLLVKEELLI